jgi:hypothetical protein
MTEFLINCEYNGSSISLQFFVKGSKTEATSTLCLIIGTPDELKIVSKEESRYSDQYTLQWTVRSLSPVLNTQVSLELVRWDFMFLAEFYLSSSDNLCMCWLV